MNHLAHLALAGEDEGLLIGGFLGDFVKGQLHGERPSEIERGIHLHRHIDFFTDHHPVVTELREHFPTKGRRVAGIALDLIFDHQLAVAFEDFYSIPLAEFEKTAFRRLLNPTYRKHFPEPALIQCLGMRERSSLLKTKDREFVTRSPIWIRTRLRNGETLLSDHTIRQIRALEPVILTHFERFYPELIAEVEKTVGTFSCETSN